MSGLRREYFKDLLGDAIAVCDELEVDPEDQGAVIAALIQSDSLNGLRKAMLSPAYILAQASARPAPGSSQF